MRTPTSIRIEVTRLDGTVETAERDGLLGEYLICRQTIHQISSEQNFTIDDPRVARRHCSLVWDGSSDWLLQDLGSTNGTNVGGQLVLEEMVVPSGTQICVGDSVIQIQFGPLNDRNWRRPHASHLRPGYYGQTSDNPTAGEVSGARLEASQSSDNDETVINVDGAGDKASGALNYDTDVTLVNTPTEQVSDETSIGAPAPQNTATADTTVMGFSSMPDNTVAESNATQVLETKGRETPAPANLITTNTVASQKSERSIFDANSKAKQSSIVNVGRDQLPTDAAKTTHSSAANLLHSDTMLEEMVLAGLLNTEKARSIESEARNSGRTVFATIVNDANLTNHTEIHEWGAARAACRRITASQELHKAVRTTDWLPLNSAEKAGILLLETNEGEIGEYATTDPFDVPARDWVTRYTNKNPVRPVLVSPTVFKDALKRIRRDLNEEGKGEIGITVDIDWESAERLRDNLEDQDVPIIVDYILKGIFPSSYHLCFWIISYLITYPLAISFMFLFGIVFIGLPISIVFSLIT